MILIKTPSYTGLDWYSTNIRRICLIKEVLLQSDIMTFYYRKEDGISPWFQRLILGETSRIDPSNGNAEDTHAITINTKGLLFPN